MITNSEIYFLNLIVVMAYALVCKAPRFSAKGHFYIAILWSIILIYIYYVVLEIEQNMKQELGRWGLINPFLFIVIYLSIDGIAKRALSRTSIIESIFLLYKNEFALKDWIAFVIFITASVAANYYLVLAVYYGYFD